MSDKALTSIENKIESLINDKINYTFVELKSEVEEILKSEEIFSNDNMLDTKAFDLYFNIVITKRNTIQKQKEQSIKKEDANLTKYDLIEQICKKLEFESKEALLLKVEELENRTLTELNSINENS